MSDHVNGFYCVFLKEESETYQLFFTSSKNIDPSQSYRSPTSKSIVLLLQNLSSPTFFEQSP